MKTTPPRVEAGPFLIYALGGGWGHLTRAAALTNALPPGPTRILANSPYVQIVRAAGMPVEEVTSEAARTMVEEFQGTVIVDTFPRGLMGELRELLPTLAQKKILVHRDLNPKYVEWGKLKEFVALNYDLVLCPGEDGPLAILEQAHKTEPWVVREPQVRSSDIVVCASGRPDELGWFGEVAAMLGGHATVRCIAAELPPGCPQELWVRYWPAIDWIGGARVVIGGAGYNTVSECTACGVPLIARARPRKYDRQRLRAQQAGVRVVETPAEAVDLAVKLARIRPAKIPFRNGAVRTAELISTLLHREKSAQGANPSLPNAVNRP